jgi:hypothetical protein
VPKSHQDNCWLPFYPWTMETVTAGLARFYREIAGVGLVFPLGPIMISRSGKWPWRTSRWRPSSVVSSAYLRWGYPRGRWTQVRAAVPGGDRSSAGRVESISFSVSVMG